MLGSALQYENLVRQARSLLDRGNHVDARTACQQLLKLRKNSPEALQTLAEIEWREMKREQAVETLKKYIRLYPQDTRVQEVLADWLRTMGLAREAVQWYERVLRRKPNDPFASAGLARCYLVLNENEEADRVLKPFIDSPNEHFMPACVYAALQLNLKNYEEAIRVASRHAGDTNLHDDGRMELYLVMGQSYEKIGEYDKAFDAYKSAHSINPPPFDPKELESEVRALMRVFSKANLAKMPRATEIDSSRAVIVICRPRSGSTMLERIISSHPETSTTGEHTVLRDVSLNLQLSIGSTLPFPDAATDLDRRDVNTLGAHVLDVLRTEGGDARRMINKYVGNWRYTGMVQLLLPHASVIDLQRNAIDNGLAWYASQLGIYHPYSYDLRHIGLQYRAQQALMNHFKDVLEIPILTVHYEEIVADQERWTREILEFCGLGFHEDTLRFHEAGEKRQKTVAAGLSYNQVRQPIYKTSVGRAEKFGKHIEPLLEGLEEGRKLWGLIE